MAPPVDWKPVVKGGTDHPTHHLVATKTGYVLRKSWQTITFGLAVTSIGVGLVVPAVLALRESISFAGGFTLAFGFFVAAGGLMFLGPRAIRFDRTRRVVLIGGRSVGFGEIAALQLLGERVEHDEAPSFDSYELNLVLKDGSRLNLVDHSRRGQLEQEAERLAQLIDCRVLDEKTDGVAIVRVAR